MIINYNIFRYIPRQYRVVFSGWKFYHDGTNYIIDNGKYTRAISSFLRTINWMIFYPLIYESPIKLQIINEIEQSEIDFLIRLDFILKD